MRVAVRGCVHNAVMASSTTTPSRTAFRSVSTPTPTSLPSLARLHAEWQRLIASRAATRRINGWQVVDVSLRDVDDLLERTGYRPPRRAAAEHGDDRGSGDASDAVAAAERSNEVFGRVVHLARTDDLAARVALQRLLPGLVAQAKRGRPVGPRLDELLSGAWTALRTFNPNRRLRYFAPSLLRDSNYHAFVRDHRRAGRFVLVADRFLDQRPAREEDPLPAHEMAELIDQVRRGGRLGDQEVELLVGMARGDSARLIALADGVPERTVRYRRAALIDRLRRHQREGLLAETA